MAREGGFFSGSERKDKRIAGNLGPSTPIRGEYTLGPLNKNQGATYPSNVKPKKGFSIKDVYDSSKGLVKKPFFSQEVGQIASATSDLSGLLANKQPLSPIGSDVYNKEVEGFVKEMKESPFYRRNFDLDTGERIDKYFNPIPGEAKFGEEEI